MTATVCATKLRAASRLSAKNVDPLSQKHYLPTPPAPPPSTAHRKPSAVQALPPRPHSSLVTAGWPPGSRQTVHKLPAGDSTAQRSHPLRSWTGPGIVNSFFPSQVAGDAEKMSRDYGLQVGRAIQNEWFSNIYTRRSRSGRNSYSTRTLEVPVSYVVIRYYMGGLTIAQKAIM